MIRVFRINFTFDFEIECWLSKAPSHQPLSLAQGALTLSVSHHSLFYYFKTVLYIDTSQLDTTFQIRWRITRSQTRRSTSSQTCLATTRQPAYQLSPRVLSLRIRQHSQDAYLQRPWLPESKTLLSSIAIAPPWTAVLLLLLPTEIPRDTKKPWHAQSLVRLWCVHQENSQPYAVQFSSRKTSPVSFPATVTSDSIAPSLPRLSVSVTSMVSQTSIIQPSCCSIWPVAPFDLSFMTSTTLTSLVTMRESFAVTVMVSSFTPPMFTLLF